MYRDEWYVVRPKSYDRAAKKLDKKNADVDVIGLLQSTCQIIRYFAATSVPPGDRRFGDLLPGFETYEVYKYRCPLGKSGKRESIRLVYALLRDENKIIPLIIYEKADKKDVKPAEKIQLLKKLNIIQFH